MPAISGTLPAISGTLPTISGAPKAGDTLICSSGAWSGSPTFAYQWGLSGTPIQRATSSTHKVQSIDEGLTLTCTVTASDAAGAGTPVTSRGVRVPVPKVHGCPAATGKLSGSTLGLVRLGMTRAQAQHAYTRSSNRGKEYQDFFCLTPIGVRAGATIAAAQKALKLEAPVHIGLNLWYLGTVHGSTVVLKSPPRDRRGDRHRRQLAHQGTQGPGAGGVDGRPSRR